MAVPRGVLEVFEAVDIFEALNPHRELFIAFGGHAGAAGMTLEAEQLDALSEILETYVKRQRDRCQGQEYIISR